MKNLWNRLRTILLALLYVAIYFVVSLSVQTAYMIWQKASGDFSLAELSAKTVNNSYALSVIAVVISFWIYLIMGHVRKTPIDKAINNEKQPFILNAMAISLAFGLRLLVTVYYHYSQNIEVLKESIDAAAAITPELTGTLQLFIAVMSVVVIAPLFEEFLFRGIVMYELKRVMRPWAAITVQGILFGVVHGVLFQSLFAIVIGILLGIVYHKTKSLKLSAVCHGAFNFSVILTQTELNAKISILFIVMGLLLSVFSMIYILKSNKSQ